MTLFGAVGLEEGEDVLGDVFHHTRGEGGVVQIGDIFCLYHLVFLSEWSEKNVALTIKASIFFSKLFFPINIENVCHLEN